MLWRCCARHVTEVKGFDNQPSLTQTEAVNTHDDVAMVQARNGSGQDSHSVSRYDRLTSCAMRVASVARVRRTAVCRAGAVARACRGQPQHRGQRRRGRRQVKARPGQRECHGSGACHRRGQRRVKARPWRAWAMAVEPDTVVATVPIHDDDNDGDMDEPTPDKELQPCGVVHL